MKVFLIQDQHCYVIQACLTRQKAIELCNKSGSIHNDKSYREVELFTDGYQVEALPAGPIPVELLKGY